MKHIASKLMGKNTQWVFERWCDAMDEDKRGDTARIPAKKWGDTEIAERGRSVLVKRASYRSAGLIPHQRGWTDAG